MAAGTFFMHAHPESHSRPGSGHLKKLLAERNQYNDRAPAIDAEIRRLYEQRVSMLILDMCGFSRLTLSHGIIHFLAMVEQMHQAAFPAIKDNGGRIVKTEADNIFAVFAAPAQAVDAGTDIFRAFQAMNSVLPDERDLRGSIGIGYGDTLLIGGEDLFGCEMNLACKLGEDLAANAEILLTTAAYEALPEGKYVCEPVTFTVSGVVLPSHRFVRTMHPKVAAAPVASLTGGAGMA